MFVRDRGVLVTFCFFMHRVQFIYVLTFLPIYFSKLQS